MIAKLGRRLGAHVYRGVVPAIARPHGGRADVACVEDGLNDAQRLDMKSLLFAILVLAVGGLAFSGYLSYRELFGSSTVPACTPVGEPGTMLGAPPCIYGFFMYLAILVLSVIAVSRRRAQP